MRTTKFSIQFVLKKKKETSSAYILKCLPVTNCVQTIRDVNIIMEPELNENDFDIIHDKNDNKILLVQMSGSVKEMKIRVEGAADIDYSHTETYGDCRIFSEFTEETTPDEETEHLYESMEKFPENDFVRAYSIMQYLFGKINDSEKLIKCMLTLCRMEGICIRCVYGLNSMMKKPQYWVEVYTEYGFLGLDPINQCLTNEGYLKISQGKDLSDCRIIDTSAENHMCLENLKIKVIPDGKSSSLFSKPGRMRNHERKNSFLQKIISSDSLLIWMITKRLNPVDKKDKIYMEDFSKQMKLPIRKASNVVKRLQDNGYLIWKYDNQGEEGTYIEFTDKWWDICKQMEKGAEKTYQAIVEKFGRDRFMQYIGESEELYEIITQELQENGDDVYDAE